jgi:membrane-bound lytic murein transglycosylase MltF
MPKTLAARRLALKAWLASLALGLAGSLRAAPRKTAPPRAPALRVAPVATDDFDGMLARRLVRVAAPYSRSLYFNDKGRERGIAADLVRDLERWLNAQHRDRLGDRPLTVVVRPTTRDRLLSDVAEGRADIAVGNLTVNDARRALVDFAVADQMPPVSERVVTGPVVGPLADASALSGKTVHVRLASSYHESLVALDARFVAEGRPPMQRVAVPDALEDEDMMEMVDAGLLDAIVVDDWKVRIWAPLLPKLHVNPGAVVREGGQVGWGIRHGSPQLRATLDAFYEGVVRKEGPADRREKAYGATIRRLNNAAAAADRQRFDDTLALFRRYGARYRFDPLMLAAQGYQESRLDQTAVSPVGAIGIMQLMPATGEEMDVGDIHEADANVHAGAKYMDWLMSRDLDDASLGETDRALFAFAAYNCGPGRLRSLRRDAAKRGLDPDRWFNHVEQVTAEQVGLETTTYVRNIYKYYVAYALMTRVGEAQRKARDTLQRDAP